MAFTAVETERAISTVLRQLEVIATERRTTREWPAVWVGVRGREFLRRSQQAVAEMYDAAAEPVLVDERQIGARIGRQCGGAPELVLWNCAASPQLHVLGTPEYSSMLAIADALYAHLGLAEVVARGMWIAPEGT